MVKVAGLVEMNGIIFLFSRPLLGHEWVPDLFGGFWELRNLQFCLAPRLSVLSWCHAGDRRVLFPFSVRGMVPPHFCWLQMAPARLTLALWEVIRRWVLIQMVLLYSDHPSGPL